MKKRKINTMEELSEAIGVSRPTLSRYFQDARSVRGSTSEKIRKGLEQIEYVPNFFATRMNRKSTGLIGVIVPHFNDLFYTSLLEAAELTALDAGFTIITQSSHGTPAREEHAIDQLISMNADGVLIAPLGANSSKDALERLRSNAPFVFVDSKLPDMLDHTDFVGTNNRQSIALITEYLCRTGDAPAFLAMPRLNSNSLEREAAYIEKIQELGFEPRILNTEALDDSWDFEAFGYQLMDDMLSRGRLDVRTVLCANDRLAIGALRAANRHGLTHPGRDPTRTIRIAGHDDHPLSRFMTPALTTVAQDIDGIGKRAIQILVNRINGVRNGNEDPEHAFFDAALKVRESA